MSNNIENSQTEIQIEFFLLALSKTVKREKGERILLLIFLNLRIELHDHILFLCKIHIPLIPYGLFVITQKYCI